MLDRGGNQTSDIWFASPINALPSELRGQIGQGFSPWSRFFQVVRGEASSKIIYTTSNYNNYNRYILTRFNWMIASASAAAAGVPLPGLNVVVDLALLTNEVSLYKSQLGLPDENSYEFRKMTPENQEKVRKFCITSNLQMASFLATYTASSTVEEFARFIPVVGLVIAGGITFSSTYYFLHQCLNELEETALKFLDEMTSRTVDDVGID